MPNEHLKIPEHPGEWAGYHAASREALGEGELADRWLEEQGGIRGMADYARIAGIQGHRDSAEQINYQGWRFAEEQTVRVTTGLARSEADVFTRIAAIEAAKSLTPTIGHAALAGVAAELARLPPGVGIDGLAHRRHVPDRGPREVMLEVLSRFGVRPDDPGFSPILAEARLRVQRNAGDIAGVFKDFTRSAEIAVATAFEKTLPSATWEGSAYKQRCDELRGALDSWDSLLHSFDAPGEQDMVDKAKECSARLIALAAECGPDTALANQAAFTALTGLAMMIAIGERMTAQIAARAGQPTVQGMFDRLCEVPNHEPAEKGSAMGQRFEKGYDKLAKTWKSEISAITGNLHGAGADGHYVQSCIALASEISGKLDRWDAGMKDAGNLVTPGGLANLKATVGGIATDLAFLRRFLQGTEGLDRDAGGYPKYRAAREMLMEAIDTVAAQMQRRLAAALNVGM